MTNSPNNMNAPLGGDPGKTGDLSPVAQAVAVRAATKVAASQAEKSGAQARRAQGSGQGRDASAAPSPQATSASGSSAAAAYASAKDEGPVSRLRAKMRKTAQAPASTSRRATPAPAPSQAPAAGEQDAGKTASGSKPTRRSARGSEVQKREKEERREAREARKAGKAAVPSSARGTGAARRSAAASGAKTSGSSGRVILPGGSKSRRGGGKGKGAFHLQQDVMKYAADNRAVRGLYALTTGPQRHLFWLAVAALVAVGIYFPVRDFYISQRTVAILAEQNAIRDKYNDSIGKEVEGLLSQEGIEDAARKEFGMVMPGEKTIDVQGLDEEGNPVVVDVSKEGSAEDTASSDDGESKGEEPDASQPEVDPSDANGAASKGSSGKLKGQDAVDKNKTGSGAEELASNEDPKTSAEVEAAERAVLENSPWYLKVLDALFFFDGVNGMAVVSTGE